MVRAFLFRHRWLAPGLVAAALLMKMLVPAGFMPTMGSGTILVQICTAMGVQTAEMDMPGAAGDADGQAADQPCAFSGLSAPALGGADPLLLAAAIVFILAAAFRGEHKLVLRRGSYLRPPAQGPPATA